MASVFLYLNSGEYLFVGEALFGFVLFPCLVKYTDKESLTSI